MSYYYEGQRKFIRFLNLNHVIKFQCRVTVMKMMTSQNIAKIKQEL